jgi:hypothetical protein
MQIVSLLLFLYRIFCLGSLLAILSHGASARADELNSAFVAAFGTSAPLERHVKQQVLGGMGAGEKEVDLSVTPQFLVPLQDGRFALVVSETTRTMRAEGASNNAISVAYLSQITGAWAVEHVWFEVGGLGFAGSSGAQVKTFGNDPIYFSTHEWCGSNSCSETIKVLALEKAGPHVVGDMRGGAVYPVDFPEAPSSECESYNYTALVGPPASISNLFSITYKGWTAPYRKLRPKRSFRRTADVVTKGKTLVTGLKTPDCMR